MFYWSFASLVDLCPPQFIILATPMQKCYQIRHYMDFPARFSDQRPGWEFKALCIPETHFAMLETGHKTFGILIMLLLNAMLH